jgi:hypothetical protein
MRDLFVTLGRLGLFFILRLRVESLILGLTCESLQEGILRLLDKRF